MARAGLGLSIRKLAIAAKVSPQTVVRFERGEAIRKRTIDSLRQVLEAAGVTETADYETLARVWQAANDKARELGWIV